MMTKDEALKMSIEAIGQTIHRHIANGQIWTGDYVEENSYPVLLNKAINACKEALEQPITRDWKDTINERIAKDDEFKEALEQPAQSITEGATMFKQVGNSPKPSPPPPIHACTYSRTMNQEYPRKCVHCGKVEALEQPAQEPLTRAQQVIRANNKALEQPAQEPVAHFVFSGNVWSQVADEYKNEHFAVPLYIHPHQWQGLTDDEIVKAFNLCDWMNEPITEFARAIEQALKEKNAIK